MQLPGVRLVRLSVCPVSHTPLCGLQRRSRCGIQVHHRQAPASTECCRSRRQRHAEVRPPTQPSPARRAALARRSSAGAVQAVCNGPSTPAAQSNTVHDGLLHPHLRHCSSPASAGWQVTPHHSTRRTSASTPQTLLVASICGPPAAISCSYRDTGVPCSVIGPLL